MSIEPYWNLPSYHKQTRQILKNKDVYCLNCQSPNTISKQMYCSLCFRKLMLTGLEPSRIKIGSVYLIAINYQQYLYRSIFKCNAPLKARGIKENRIPFKLSDTMIKKLSYKIHNLIMSQKNIHRELYKECQDNTKLHILYRILLYYIAYYQENNNTFKSIAHFYSSMIYVYYTTIERFYIKSNNKLPYRLHRNRTHYLATDKYAIVTELDVIYKLALSDVDI